MTALPPETLQRLRSGEASVLRSLVRDHTPVLFDWLGGLGVREADREDVVQEVWVRVLRARADYSGAGSFRGWLYRIARHVAVDRARAEAARAERDRGASVADVHGPCRPSDRAGVAEVERLLAALTERQRDVVILRVLEGWSTADTARELGCAIGTVKATLSQALRKLRHLVAEETRDGARDERAMKDDVEHEPGSGRAPREAP